MSNLELVELIADLTLGQQADLEAWLRDRNLAHSRTNVKQWRRIHYLPVEGWS